MKTPTLIFFLMALANSVCAQIEWQEITSPTSQKLNCIQFVNNQIGYIGGDQTLLKTTDGGLNWNTVVADSIVFFDNILDMHWFNEQHGIIMQGWGGSIETYNGGSSWSSVFPAPQGFCQQSSVFFLNQNQGFMGGSGCFYGHTIERFDNNSWVTAIGNPFGDAGDNWVSSIEFMNADTGFAGTHDGIILRTVDAGLTWDTITNPSAGQMITDFVFYEGGTIRATNHNQQWGIMISTDYGLTWDWDPETATFFYPQMNAAHIDNNGTTYLGGIEGNQGTSGVIFDNSAGWWSYENIGAKVNDISSIHDSTTFLVCDSGVIYVNSISSSVGIQDASQVMFSFAPNPTIDFAQISGLKEDAQSYSIIDPSGKVIKQESGTFGRNFKIEVRDIVAGTYFLTVSSETENGMKRFIKL